MSAAKQQKNSSKRKIGKPFVKGDPRINRKGRPPGGQLFAELIAGETKDGAELIRTGIALLRNKKGSQSSRIRIWELLVERLVGRAPLTIAMGGAGGGAIPVSIRQDLSKLTSTELDDMEAILASAAGRITDAG